MNKKEILQKIQDGLAELLLLAKQVEFPSHRMKLLELARHAAEVRVGRMERDEALATKPVRGRGRPPKAQ